MIRAQSDPPQRTHVVSLAVLERVADRANVGVQRVGGSYYAVVLNELARRVDVYQAYAAADEPVAS